MQRITVHTHTHAHHCLLLQQFILFKYIQKLYPKHDLLHQDEFPPSFNLYLFSATNSNKEHDKAAENQRAGVSDCSKHISGFILEKFTAVFFFAEQHLD